ncbi:MAG: FAD-binding protein, partial [candidate division Zixibacteria bacterium]
MKQEKYDYLVIGSGIAGLFFALKVAEAHPGASIAVVTKKQVSDSNTNRAQGGIAAVMGPTDSVEAHIADTIRAGCGLCDRKVVESIVEAGPQAVEELIQYGVSFTQRDGQFDLGREGGHSANRVMHASDLTGQEIERAIRAACKSISTLKILRNHMAVDLLTSVQGGHRVCVGAQIITARGKVKNFVARATMLATGGLGQLYHHTSNPKIATGDGQSIAFRAGASVGNAEFIQFHPTTLYAPGRWPFLISEAVRGEGGI